MSINERLVGSRVQQILNSSMRLDAQIEERLRASREQALLAKRPERATGLAWAGIPGFGWPVFGELSLRLLIPTFVLAFALLSIYAWRQDHQVAELVELDTQLLTDDLPIDAYLDKGFEAWMNDRASE
jgi:hypothetical protein